MSDNIFEFSKIKRCICGNKADSYSRINESCISEINELNTTVHFYGAPKETIDVQVIDKYKHTKNIRITIKNFQFSSLFAMKKLEKLFDLTKETGKICFAIYEERHLLHIFQSYPIYKKKGDNKKLVGCLVQYLPNIAPGQANIKNLISYGKYDFFPITYNKPSEEIYIDKTRVYFLTDEMTGLFACSICRTLYPDCSIFIIDELHKELLYYSIYSKEHTKMIKDIENKSPYEFFSKNVYKTAVELIEKKNINECIYECEDGMTFEITFAMVRYNESICMRALLVKNIDIIVRPTEKFYAF